MASTSAPSTDKAIEQLTEQIAKLSINLLEKQIPPTKPVYYSENSNRGPQTSSTRDAICYYCGYKEHFIKDCRI